MQSPYFVKSSQRRRYHEPPIVLSAALQSYACGPSPECEIPQSGPLFTCQLSAFARALLMWDSAI